MDHLDYGTGLYREGTFYFTNPTKTAFTALWNNKEYTFEPMTTSPLIIENETSTNIQEIRKLFAKKLAQKVFHESKEYRDLVKRGGFIPATYDENKVLGPIIQQCLTPLPKGKVETKQLQEDIHLEASRPISGNEDLNRVFEDYQPPILGKM